MVSILSFFPSPTLFLSKDFPLAGKRSQGAAGSFRGGGVWETHGSLWDIKGKEGALSPQRGKSIADLWDSFLPEKATLDSRGLGDTTGNPPERVNGESRGTRRDRQSRQADTTCLTPDDPSERSIHTSAQVSPVVLWRQPPVSVFLCSVSPSSLQLCSESIPPSLPAPS